jgi:SEC-C motif/HNH endonuclease
LGWLRWLLMAEHRPSVPAAMKRRLTEDAGGKCANPGCAAFRTHLHHIEEWAVYRTHNAEQMIAICPTCHDAVHSGDLRISDEALLRWKKIERPERPRDDVIFVESGPEPHLELGGIDFVGEDGGTAVFQLSQHQGLSYRLEADDVFLLNLRVATADGLEVLRITDNRVRIYEERAIAYEKAPGHVRVMAVAEDVIDPWILRVIEAWPEHFPTFRNDLPLQLLNIQVVDRGVVQVEGIWQADDKAILITDSRVVFISPTGPVSVLTHPDEERNARIFGPGPITERVLFGIDGQDRSYDAPFRTPPKPGRNQPCWCGSGEKFKRCHGR